MNEALVSQEAVVEPALPTSSLSEAGVTVGSELPKIHRVNLEGLLRRQDGKFVGIDFVKVDGTQRALNGRLGVKFNLQGGVNSAISNDRPYLTMFDAKAMGYRNVNLATVSRVRAQGQEYQVIG